MYHTLAGSELSSSSNGFPFQPDPSLSLSELITSGHFRVAAVKAAQILTDSDQKLSPEQIFDLVYKRLACLILCNQNTIAVQEVKALEDLNGSHYRDEKSGEHFMPWDLRILAVRLQGIGFGDIKRGVIGYYDLVSDARANLTTLKRRQKFLVASDKEAKENKAKIILWERRLSELGLRIASALIEMEDFEGATRFLSTFQPSASTPSLKYQQALIWLHLGNVEAAQSCASDEKVINTLAHVADEQFEKAVAGWEDLIATGDTQDVALWKQNLAVSLIYLGRIEEVRNFRNMTSKCYSFIGILMFH